MNTPSMTISMATPRLWLNLACILMTVLGGLLVPNVSHANCPDLYEGDRVIVQVDGLAVRETYGTDEPNPPRVDTGATGTILRGPETANAHFWYEVEWDTPVDNVKRGWSAGIIAQRVPRTSIKALKRIKEGAKATEIRRERTNKQKAIAEKLFRLPSDMTYYDYNDYGCHPHNDSSKERCDGYYGGHSGWDAQTKTKGQDPFYSLTAGTVIRATEGNAVYPSIIAVYNADYDKTTFYLHASEVNVRRDQEVTPKTRDPLGKQGETGRADGPHVHVEVREGETRFPSCGIAKPSGNPNIDPIPYLFESINGGNGNNGTPPPLPPDDATVSVSPASVDSPAVGEQFTIALDIEDGENVAGYQATLEFDTSALQYVDSENGDFLPAGAFFVPPRVAGNKVTLASSAINAVRNGDGTLATIIFEVVKVKASTLTLSEVALVDPDGGLSTPQIENGEVTKPTHPPVDVNRDGVVNIQDLVLVGANFGKTGENIADVNGDGVVNIVDLVKVASEFGKTAAAPSLHPQALALLSPADVQVWLTQARALDPSDATVQRGIIVLEHLLSVLTPKATALLPNYPNPFNPETWIPYHLAHGADVQITIYNTKGGVVRRLDLGHQSAGYYTARAKAGYWNGRNESGELIASGIYFYQLRAGDYSALRRMVIVK